ncbi:Biodegradative arginine decarboxylase, partial [Bienertia sinuspersici]
MYSLLWCKLCSVADDHNRVRPNMHTSQPTLPRSNRQYVPPLMVARGRGKKLSELHTSKTKVSEKSNIGTESYLGVKTTSLAKRSHSHLYKKGHSSVLRNENRASFNPLYDVGARYEDFGSPEESLREGANSDSSFHSSPEDEDMDFNEGIENPNGLNIEDVNEIYLKVSARNSTNRLHYQKELAHRVGSKPFRQVIWKDLGANKGIKPDLANVFYTTRKKDNSLPNAETTQKYNQVLESRVEALQVENNDLKGRVGPVEAQMKRFEDMMMNQLNVNPSSS